MNLHLVKQIHEAPERLVMAVTGGGASAISALLSVPGGSATLLEAVVPYQDKALEAFLQTTPQSACSARTARLMAMAAYQRACRLAPEAPVLGLGATAALATSRERRGEDKCFIALQTSGFTQEVSISLERSLGREAQEALCAEQIIIHLARALGIEVPASAMGQVRLEAGQDAWQSLLQPDALTAVVHDLAAPAGEASGKGAHTLIERQDGSRLYLAQGEEVKALLPGSFNPPHAGHLGMMEVAEQLLGCPVHPEISVRNVDKPPLDYLDMATRLLGMPGKWLVYSNAPTFVEKARLFPGAVFAVGADTILRVSDPRYYSHSTALDSTAASLVARDAAIKEIADLGNRFLVFGRMLGGQFTELPALSLDANLLAICDPVQEGQFRIDISSSTIRNKVEPE